MSKRTEDEVRDYAKKVLGFDDNEKDVKQGAGQTTTFNQLGFKGIKISLMVGICQIILTMLLLS